MKFAHACAEPRPPCRVASELEAGCCGVSPLRSIHLFGPLIGGSCPSTPQGFRFATAVNAILRRGYFLLEDL